ncbi:MAG TPA: DNA-processing protein DprA [Candidatus Binatia bacterium]|nr:DNA-processing protein DprA [Candidatus Binatia bacterium]
MSLGFDGVSNQLERIEPIVIDATPLKKGDVFLPLTQMELARWIALSRVEGLGCVNFKKLAEHFADPTEAFSAPAEALAGIQGLDPNVIDGLRRFSAWAEMRAEIIRAEKAGITIVPFTAASYPARLRLIADPPPLLYVKGEIRGQDERAVAVVGSRSASDYGRRVARDLSRGLAALGFTVVSGMARGIDGAAHEAALNAGGRTIAVLGSGVDRAYPPEHDKLYQRICENGAVVSEFPLGTRPVPFNFPVRNRLISGLSLGVVVVEATEKSGSLITAALALEQGREVFAVPGEVGASRSRGVHRLIRQGAKLVETVNDIVEEIAPQLLSRAGSADNALRRTLPQHLGDEFQKIFALFQEQALQIDEVIENSGCSPSRVSEVLLELELLGYLKQLPGKKYRLEG